MPLLERDLLAAVAQCARHPHQLLQELVDAPELGLIAQPHGVVDAEGNARDIDQLGLDPRAAGELGHDEPRDREAHASLAHRAEEDGDEERATGLGHEGALLAGITAGTSARPPTPIAAQKAL